MEATIVRDVKFLKIYAGVVTLVCGILLLTAFQANNKTKFSEIDVERINVVEKDGSLRMVISNSARQHQGIAGGKLIKRTEPREAGILFFCESGDECGGLAFSAVKTGNKVEAYGGLTFDQFMQDETVKLAYVDSDGWRRVGVTIQDRSNIPAPEWETQYEKVRKMPRGPERDAAMKPLSAPMRAFFGKTRENGSGLVLADTEGRTRISMIVDVSGQPRLNFLDEKGNVIQSFPAEVGTTKRN